VRTKSAGHIRDIRRLVVAMSRARLGLYVFCRVDLFKNCYELTRTFNLMLKRPTKLQLIPSERNITAVTRLVR
jgi:intron-binding protein aquarius